MKTLTIYQRNCAIRALLALLVLTLASCSKDDDSSNNTAGEDIQDYLLSLPAWEAFCPVQQDTVKQFDPNLEFDCADKIVTTTTPCSITRTPEEIVTHDPNSEILYLGSLIQGEGYMGGLGSIQSLPIYQRAPITISISFQMAGNSRVVENPTLATVKEAIGDLVETAQNAGHVSGSSIFFVQKSCYSVEQTALALGLSVKYMAGSAKAQLEYESTTETNTLSAYFVQKMFTTSMGLPQRPGDLFSAEFTQDILDEQIAMGRIGSDNLPVYVSNMVWGRMMTLTMTSSYDETRMAAALEASYKFIGGTLDAQHIETLQNSSIKLVTLGGDAQDALDFLRTGNLGDYFMSNAPLTTAVPISYTLRNLSDNEIAKVSEIAEYDIVQDAVVEVQLFNHEGQWRSAFLSNGMTDGLWETTLSNLQQANEAYSFVYYGAQTLLYNTLTFPASVTGYPFDFHLKNTAVEGDRLALVHNDTEGLDNNFTENTISIGDIDDYENDDFEIVVIGDKVYAIGFIMKSNSDSPEEYLEVYAEQDNCYLAQLDLPTIENGFVGLISPVPIKKIWFNEDDDDDDMGVLNFYFGYRNE